MLVFSRCNREACGRMCRRQTVAGIGVNFKDGLAGWFGSDMKWWYHPTESDTVDVSVTIFTPTFRIDAEYIPEGPFLLHPRGLSVTTSE